MLSRQKRGKLATSQSLANAALNYLGRFAASEDSLRRILKNKIRRAAFSHPDFADDARMQKDLQNAIECIIDKHKKSGVLNDAAFAVMKVSSARRRGLSKRAIQQRLNKKGVDADFIAEALKQNDDGADPNEVELKAAFHFAKRRKLGPFRRKGDETKRDVFALKRKEIATMARAGFTLTIVKKVLGADVLDEDMSEL